MSNPSEMYPKARFELEPGLLCRKVLAPPLGQLLVHQPFLPLAAVDVTWQWFFFLERHTVGNRMLVFL